MNKSAIMVPDGAGYRGLVGKEKKKVFLLALTNTGRVYEVKVVWRSTLTFDSS